MLRIHFTGIDLARVRIAARPDALWESILSFHRLRDKHGGRAYRRWRCETRARLHGETRLLASLVPARGYFPDFLTPPEGVLGVGPAIEALRETPPHILRRDLSLLSPRGQFRSRPGWADALADGDARALDRLIGVVRGYHRAAVAPYWPHIRARVEADRAARGRALLDGGADQLLASLPGMIRWRPPVLEADYPVDRDLYLGGRGLLLLPSFFCRRTPVTYHDQDFTPVLVYPVRYGAGPAAGVRGSAAEAGDRGGESLGKLVGHTRSAVLQTIGHGCTTSELARRVGVSAASASQHASVLREAGLVVTLRQGNAVLHTLTPLGAALLRGGGAAVPMPARAAPAATGASR